MDVRWEGIYPAMTTKFHEDGSLDLDMFEKNIRAQADAGIHGIVLAGSLGEASTLTEEERNILLSRTLEITEEKIPVIMNVAEKRTDEAVRVARQAQKNGAHGLMMLPPIMYKADARETVEFFKAVANAIDIPVMVYNNPVDYSIEVTIDMLEELTECDNIQAIKESTRDLTNVTRLINRFGDRIKILCGVDTIAFEAMVMGAVGWVAGLVCAFPRETVVIYELIRAGRIEEARNLFRWFLPLLELDINPKLVQNIKLAEVATGIGTEHVRPPRLPLIGEERRHVLDVINSALKSRPVVSDVSI